MTFAQSCAGLMLFVTGLWSGVILTFAVERINLWARMPVEQYAVDFRRSLFRVDPLQPVLGVVAMIAAAVFAWSSAGSPRVLAWVGIALIGIVVGGSIIIAEPINSKFRRLPEGQVPEHAARYRDVWRRFHLARTAVALMSFACLVAAVVVPTR